MRVPCISMRFSGEVEFARRRIPTDFMREVRPNTASVVYQLQGYQWQDDEWQQRKSAGYRETDADG